MAESDPYSDAVSKLRDLLVRLNADDRDFQRMVGAREQVFERFQKIFSPENLPHVTGEEFRSFLQFESNRHWSGLHRQGPKMTADMSSLRNALTILLDEPHSIGERIDRAVGLVDGMGKAVATAILLVVYPTRYGVWNMTSEGGLKALSLWPTFARGDSLGKRYEELSAILLKLSTDIGVDLWTLDALWWRVTGEPSVIDEEQAAANGQESGTSPQRFTLERHLHEFLRDNWECTELGTEWALYSEPGDDQAGYLYPCGAWKIDLLARHRSKRSWLVVELKRDRSGDAAVGQILRYMGWIRKHLAEPGEEVRGLIIARDADDGLLYALTNVPDVDLKLYEVQFRLLQSPKIETPDESNAVRVQGKEARDANATQDRLGSRAS